MAQAHYHKDIQLPQLRSFCAAATEGNFTAAAESMNLSVSAVWQQVRTLEQQLGATLLRRHGRSVELTAESIRAAPMNTTEGYDALHAILKSRYDFDTQ